MKGQEIKNWLKEKRLFQWELAAALNVSEFTLSRWLRGSLSPEHEKAVLEAVERMTRKE